MVAMRVLPIAACLLSGTALAQDLMIIPSSIDFFAVREGTCRNTQARIFNNGTATVNRPAIEISGSGVFTPHVKDRPCPVRLAPGDTCRVTIRFCPEWNEDYRAVLSADGMVEAEVRGQGQLAKQ
jgi:hypothetical protein